MSATADRFEARGTPEREAPRPGLKIAVVRSSYSTDVFLAEGIIKTQSVRKGRFYLDNVYIEDSLLSSRRSPVFTALRNVWDVTQDDKTKQTAIDFVQNVNLFVLPTSQAREMVETFRRERANGVNYSKRSFNVDKARVDGEKVDLGYDLPDVGYFILTPHYLPAYRKH